LPGYLGSPYSSGPGGGRDVQRDHGTPGSGAGNGNILGNGNGSGNGNPGYDNGYPYQSSYNNFGPNSMPPADGGYTGTDSPNSSGGFNPAQPLGGPDYNNWSWEQVLNSVLGFQLPERHEVTSGRWTKQVSNSAGNGSLFLIWEATWQNNHQDYLVYLDPSVLDPKGPWAAWVNRTNEALVSAANGDFHSLKVDPRTFGSAAVALDAVETMVYNVADTFNTLSAGLSSEASQFKGQAGAAFQRMIHNLYSATSSMSQQMGYSGPGSTGDYANQITGSGLDLQSFLRALIFAFVQWGVTLSSSPLGAIAQTLEAYSKNNHDGTWSVKGGGGTDPTQSHWGNLLDETAWLRVEYDAKKLWVDTVNGMLDSSAQNALNALAQNFYSTAAYLQPIYQPPMAPVIPPSAGLNGGPNLNGLFPNGMFPNGMFNGLFPNSMFPNGMFNGLFPNGMFNGLIPNSMFPNGMFNFNSLPNPNAMAGFTGPPNSSALYGGNGGTSPLTDTLAYKSVPPPGFNSGVPGNSLLSQGLAIPGGIGPFSGQQAGVLTPTSLSLPPVGFNSGVPNNSLLSQALANPGGNSVLSQALHNPADNSVLSQALRNPPDKNNLLSQALQNPPGNSALSQALANPAGNSVLGQALANPAGNSVLDQALRHPGGNSLLDQALSNPPNNSALDRGLQGPPNNSALDRALQGPPNHTALSRALQNPPNNSVLDRHLLQGSARPPLPGGSFYVQPPSIVGSQALLHRLGQGPLFSSALHAPHGAPGLPGSGQAASGLYGAGPALPASSGRFIPPGTGGSAIPASSGQFIPPTAAGSALQAGQAATRSGGLGGIPFYPPMMGGMGMGGMGGTPAQERERSTWLAEDEEVWGTDPGVGVGVLGRDAEDEEEADTFEEFTEQRGTRTRGGQPRQGFY